MKDMKVSNKTLLIGIFVLSFVILLINVYYLFCLNKNNVSTVYYPFSSPREFLLSLAGNSYKYGNETAPIVFIVFSEHGCPFCTQAHFNVENLIREEYSDTGKVLFVYKHLPLQDMHPNSLNASIASICAGTYDKFWEYSELLYENRKEWSYISNSSMLKDKFIEYARNLSIDTTSFEKCYLYPAVKDFVLKDADDYKILMNKYNWTIERVPTYIFGNSKELRFIIGVHDYSFFKEELDNMLE